VLILVRHGQTSLNETEHLQGKSLASLSAAGLTQAQDAAKWLKNVSRDPVLVLSSDLPRARETAVVIGAEINLEPVFSSDLRERDFGRFDGLHRDELLQLRSDAGLDNFDPTQDWDGYDGVESDAAIVARVLPSWEEHEVLRRASGTSDVVVVTHAGVITAVVYAALAIAQSRRRAIKVPPGAALAFLVADDNKLEMVQLWPNAALSAL
jgi:broad specificity phosphatase PhoE